MQPRLRKTTRLTRHTYGDNGVFGKRNIVSVSFAATDLGKAANGTTTAVSPSLATGVNSVSVQPSVPRSLTVTGISGTGTVTVTGRNAEGAVITETFVLSGTSTIAGNKAFASITSVDVPAAATASVGFGNKFGLGSRSLSSTVFRVLVIQANGTAALEAPSATALNTNVVDLNTITPTTAPNGTLQFRVYALTPTWHVDPVNGNPPYGV